MAKFRSWVFLIFLVACPVSAQERTEDQTSVRSRADLLATEREEKTSQTEPPKRSKVEHALSVYDNWEGIPFVFQSWHGFHLGGAGFPAGAGTKFGIGYTHDLGRVRPAADPNRPNRMELDAVAAYSTQGYFRGTVGLNVHHVGGAPLSVNISAQHYEFPQQEFFGFGQDSNENDRTNYLMRSTEATAGLQWKPMRLLDISGGVSYLNPAIGSGTDHRFPSTERFFSPAALPGFENQPDFVRGDTSVALDWRDNPLHPHAGGRYGVRYSEYRDQDLHAFDFRQMSVDLQQYISIPDRYRTLALHAAANFTDERAGQQVPFYFQPSLGGAQALRGFREFRFQDRNSVLMTAEYRWEAWWALDGALFVDAGQVASQRRDFHFRDFDVSYGVGFRFHSNSAFVGRLDLAFSREGFIPLLRFEHAF